MQRTNIEYLTHSWSPIKMKCTPVSAGCANCWHLAMAKRLAKNPKLDEVPRGCYAGGTPILSPAELEAPLHLKKPARIGVQFMGDLFHENISFEMVKRVFQYAANSKRHSYFFLTKRPQRMLECIRWFCQFGYRGEEGFITINLPSFFWLGVSIEDQKTADERIPILLQIPAAHRWVSVEPMLGPIDLSEWFGLYEFDDGMWALKVGSRWKDSPDWIVCGGETGPHAKPLHPDWVRSIHNQCQAAGVPFFFKSWGEWKGYWSEKMRFIPLKVGQKLSGCLIDGREYREMP